MLPAVRDLLLPIALGATGGILAGAIVWLYAARTLDNQLTTGQGRITAGLSTGSGELQAQLRAGERDLEQQIRTEVARSIDSQFSSYGITPARVQSLWRAADAAGLAGRRR